MTEKKKRMGRPILSTENNEDSSPIKQLRTKRQLSQKELSILLGGVCQSTVVRYEKGSLRPKGLILDKLNEMLRAEGLPELS